MQDDLQSLASARGLGALPAELLELAPAPADGGDAHAARRPIADLDDAIQARVRRGPEAAASETIRAHLASRPSERRLFELDTAHLDLSLPRASAPSYRELMRELSAAVPYDPALDPDDLIERLRTFDLDAARQLAALESGRELLAGPLAAELLTFQQTLERAHCPRWSLGFALLLQHLGHADAAALVTDILLEERQWQTAIEFVASLGHEAGQPLRAWVAARAPHAALSAAGQAAWMEDLGRTEALAVPNPLTLSRAHTAHLLALTELALGQEGAAVDAEVLRHMVERFPTWRFGRRVLAKALALALDGEAFVTHVVDPWLASFGADALLFSELRPLLDASARRLIAERLVREVRAYPDWVAPWRALVHFAVTDLTAGARLRLALARD